MPAPLLTTKLYIPPLRPELVPRPRLVERLDAGLHRKLALVSAPPGFGKTTLLSEWVNSQRGVSGSIPVAWLSLDAADNDPNLFWSYGIAALQTVHPGVGEPALAGLQMPRPQAPAIEALLAGLINELAGLESCQYALVLDDYHTITNQSIHDSLYYLLDHMPPDMHLVISTRADPPLPLSRLRAKSQMVEIRSRDLRFTSGEVTAFFSQVMEYDLPASDMEALEERTEGWIAGLQLAAIAMESPYAPGNKENVRRFVQSFSGSNRYILDYLAEEVLNRQPEEIQSFLLSTSILDRLSGPLCDAVAGRQNSQEVLEYLERANLFLVPLDGERKWYRYHHLFADLLQKQLQRETLEKAIGYHARASAWYEQNDMMGMAIRHALAAGMVERAALLVENAAESVLMRSEFSTFLNWVDALPDDEKNSRPMLCIYIAIASLMGSRPVEAAEAYAQQAFRADFAGTHTGALTAFYAVLAAYRKETGRCIELCQEALAQLPEEQHLFRSLVAGVLGLNALYTGNWEVASRALETAAQVSERAGNLLNTVLALSHLAEIAMMQGRLYRAQSLFRRALELAVDDRGRRKPVAGYVLIGLAHIYREQNELDTARQYYLDGIELARNWGEGAVINGYLGLADVRQAQGDPQAALQSVRTAQELALKFDAMETDDVAVAVFRAELAISQGDLARAAGWADQAGLSGDVLIDWSGTSGYAYYQAIQILTLARLFLARGRFEKALALLDALQRPAETSGTFSHVIRICVLKALAYQGLGDELQGVAWLKRALELAEPEGFIRVFDHGEPVVRLLHRASAGGICSSYVTKLLGAFDPSRLEPSREAPATGGLIEPLTGRELEVLHFLTTELSTPGIADRMMIAPSTVRTHVRKIFEKLDVHGRIEAIHKAQELGLI